MFLSMYICPITHEKAKGQFTFIFIVRIKFVSSGLLSKHLNLIIYSADSICGFISVSNTAVKMIIFKHKLGRILPLFRITNILRIPQNKNKSLSGIVAYAFNPGTKEAETGALKSL